jgi:hypothetical protein
MVAVYIAATSAVSGVPGFAGLLALPRQVQSLAALMLPRSTIINPVPLHSPHSAFMRHLGVITRG